MTNLTLTQQELNTLQRVLRTELHQDLNREPACRGKGFLEEREQIIQYKFDLLQKLGVKDSLTEIRLYEV